MSNSDNFIDLYDKYKNKIYSFFYYRFEGDRLLSEELSSDTFLKAFEHFDSYDDKYAFSTWIYTIARNVMINYLRSNKNWESIEEIEENNKIFEDEDSLAIENELNNKLTVDEVKKILDTLPDFQKECIILRYLEELEFSEIADITGKSEINVRKALSRGMKTLREKSNLLLIFVLFFSYLL